MHRSGTSAVAGVLASLGFDLGPSDDLIGSSRHNPQGHWEHRPTVLSNEMLLRHLDGAWWRPPSLERLRSLGAHATASGAALDAGFPEALKDPRFCLTLPYWTELADSPLDLVLVHRDAASVAVSLDRRHRFGVEVGLALWWHYNRCALAFAAGHRTVVVSYHELLSSPGATIDTILGFAGARAPAAPDVDAARRSLEPVLDRSSKRIDGVTSGPEVRRVEQALGDLAGAHERLPDAAVGDAPHGLRSRFPTERPTFFGRGRSPSD
jgi:hypothetical protein